MDRPLNDYEIIYIKPNFDAKGARFIKQFYNRLKGTDDTAIEMMSIENICDIKLTLTDNKAWQLTFEMILYKKEEWYPVNIFHNNALDQDRVCPICGEEDYEGYVCTVLRENMHGLFEKLKKSHQMRLKLITN